MPDTRDERPYPVPVEPAVSDDASTPSPRYASPPGGRATADDIGRPEERDGEEYRQEYPDRTAGRAILGGTDVFK
jgi:hypothetical protein